MIAGITKSKSNSEIFTEERCYITELMNDPIDETVSIARCRVLPGVTTVLHRLNHVDERYIILEGEGCIEIGELSPLKVVKGCIALIPKGVSQRITNTGQNDLIFLCVCTPRFRPTCYEEIKETLDQV